MAKYILFDTETTGNKDKDRIIQVGAMIVSSKANIEIFDELCSSDIDIAIEAMEVHNITPNMIANKPKYQELNFTKKINQLNSKENYLIAHNIDFDLGMMEKEGFENDFTLIDTLRCARHLLPDSPSHRLQFLRYSLELYLTEKDEAFKSGITIKAHDAIGDVLVMKLLLSKLVAITKEKFPDLNPIIKLAYLTKTPALMTIFRFGKYNGKNIKDIAKTDLRYMKWMRDNMDLDKDMKFTIDTYLS